MSYANVLKARLDRDRAAALRPSTVAAFAVVVLGIILLALAFAVVPPLVAALLWFPALGLTGWPLFWAGVAAFIVWGVFLRLLQRTRK